MNDATKPTVLICTVGGSHAPVLTAIQDSRPDFVWFVCTAEKAGSVNQIRGEGNCIKAHPRDGNPTLPNIPTQAGLRDDQFDVCIVPPDDPDEIHIRIRALLTRILAAQPRPRVIADYTGGTKSMTAAMLLAGLEFDEDVELSIVVGQRADLVQVRDGTQVRVRANVNRIRFQHNFRIAMSPWKHFGYAESVISLESMPRTFDPGDQKIYLHALAASRSFASWDRFDHHDAYNKLQPLGQSFGPYLQTLKTLTEQNEKQTPARLFDLYHNLERRANRGQYDDAVARAYRLLEWTAQWLLHRDAGLETAQIPAERIPEGITLPQNEKGHYFAGLRNAWLMLATLGRSEAVRAFAHNRQKEMLTLLTTRNESILAHGFRPISQATWQQWAGWLSDRLIPLLQAEARASGLKHIPPQLPTDFFRALPE